MINNQPFLIKHHKISKPKLFSYLKVFIVSFPVPIKTSFYAISCLRSLGIVPFPPSSILHFDFYYILMESFAWLLADSTDLVKVRVEKLYSYTHVTG